MIGLIANVLKEFSKNLMINIQSWIIQELKIF